MKWFSLSFFTLAAVPGCWTLALNFLQSNFTCLKELVILEEKRERNLSSLWYKREEGLYKLQLSWGSQWEHLALSLPHLWGWRTPTIIKGNGNTCSRGACLSEGYYICNEISWQMQPGLYAWVAVYWGKQKKELQVGQNLEAGAGEEVMEGCCLLTCSTCFLIQTRTTNPGMTLPTMDWTHLINHLRKCSSGLSID